MNSFIWNIDGELKDTLNSLAAAIQLLERQRYWSTGIGDHEPTDERIDIDLPKVRRLRREVVLLLRERRTSANQNQIDELVS